MTHVLPARPWLRTGAISVVVVLLVGGTMAVAWQLALARVPKHRATLERLVQAHTGLDMRFNELGLRWGWYGPEAVFRGVELREPGGAATLLRAPELTVGFDALRTMQTGQLRAGRVTLVAPEIDLVRSSVATPRRRESTRSEFTRVLERWQGGRIDVDAGTLRMPFGDGSVVLRVSRGTLRRSGDNWTAVAQLLLPERLGRHARVALSLEGNLDRTETLAGRVQFDGQRVNLGGWRELLSAYSPHARHVPAAGSGNVELRATLRAGAFASFTGEVAADDVRLASLPAPITVGYLSGSWSAAARGEVWRVDVRDLRAGVNGREAPSAALFIELDAAERQARARADLVPVDLLAMALQSTLPEVSLAGLQLGGLAQQLEIEWNGRSPRGARLAARARASDLALAAPTHGWALSNVSARLTATDRELIADLDAPSARIAVTGDDPRVWQRVELAGRVIARARERAWEAATEQLILVHDDGRASLSGGITGRATGEPLVAMRASLSDTSLDAFMDLLFPRAVDPKGDPHVPRVASGRIEQGDFEFTGAMGGTTAGERIERFTGSLDVRDVAVTGTETWPALEGLDAGVSWDGVRFSAKVASGQAAGLQITGGEVEWTLDGSSPARVSGRAFGRLEQGLEWLRAHPELHAAASNAQMIDARGDALLDFAIRMPASDADEPTVRLALSLEDARVVPGRALPPLERLRGMLVAQNGRLRPTTLAGRWLGGPVSIRVDGREAATGSRLTELHLQGVFDAATVARAAGFDGADRLHGESHWRGTLAIRQTGTELAIAARADTRLDGVASELPAPLAKPPMDALPLTLEVDVQGEQAPELRVLVENRLGGTFALELTREGWRVERGSLRIGSGIATLPATPALVLAGSIPQLDLPAWLAIVRSSGRAASRPPLWAELSTRELDIAGRRFARVEITAREDDHGLHVEASSAGLAGTLHVPADVSFERPIDVSLTRLDLPAGENDGIEALVAALAPAARVSAGEVMWRGRALGSLQADVRSHEDRVNVGTLRFAGAAHELDGSAQCTPDVTRCRVELQIASTDAARTLRDFGFADDVEAERARLVADLDWQREPDRAWQAALTGRVALALERGRVRVPTRRSDPPFALFVIPALLANEDVASSADVEAAGDTGLAFRRLTGDYSLRGGEARTANLHLDGEAEILTRGRVGLVERDYEQVAWVLEGEERLPGAVRRFAATPRVAAAWLQLRDFFGGPEVEDSRAVLHLHGSWARPIVSSPVEQEDADR